MKLILQVAALTLSQSSFAMAPEDPDNFDYAPDPIVAAAFAAGLAAGVIHHAHNLQAPNPNENDGNIVPALPRRIGKLILTMVIKNVVYPLASNDI